MKNYNLKFKVSFYFLAAIFSFAFLVFDFNKAWATSLFFESTNQEFALGEKFLISIFLDTFDESINAIEGKISFPEALLRLEEIRDGNSIVNFWIERPKIKQADAIIFSGIIPGGYKGTKGFLFSAVLEAKESGNGAIEINNVKILRNDGEGTKARVQISNFQFNINDINDVGHRYNDNIWHPDIDLPELFVPEITRDLNIFDGKWFLIFATQDKESGMDHYKVCERIETTCVIAESPYVLQNQNLDRKIFVKAIDKNGNERTVILPPKFAPWYQKPLVYIFIILAILAGVIIIRKWLWKHTSARLRDILQ